MACASHWKALICRATANEDCPLAAGLDRISAAGPAEVSLHPVNSIGLTGSALIWRAAFDRVGACRCTTVETDFPHV